MDKDELKETIELVKQGDSSAFRKLYDYSFPVVQGECLKILHNPIDTEDVTQEVYLKIYKKLESLKKPETFLGWCKQIAHNTSVDYIVHQKRKTGKDDYKPPVSDDSYEGMDQISLEDTELLPDEQAEQKERQKQLQSVLQQALNEIPPQRALCLALYEQGTSQQEISQKLRIPVGTVKSNIHYAKQALRKEIKQIEQKQEVQIHGFVLIPQGNTVTIQLPSSGTHFIASSIIDSSAKKAVWKSLSKTLFPSSKNGIWKKIIVGVLSLTILGGGIGLAVNQANQEEQKTTTITTTTASSTFRKTTTSSFVTETGRQGYIVIISNTENSQTANSMQNSAVPSETAERKPATRKHITDGNGNSYGIYIYSDGTSQTVSEQQYNQDERNWFEKKN